MLLSLTVLVAAIPKTNSPGEDFLFRLPLLVASIGRVLCCSTQAMYGTNAQLIVVALARIGGGTKVLTVALLHVVWNEKHWDWKTASHDE